MKADLFGIWVTSEVISQNNDGIFTQTGKLYKIEKTITEIWAVASWIRDLEESIKNT